MKPFFVCWNSNGRNPMIKHDTVNEAKEEAARIAAKELCAVHILQLVATCTATVKIEWDYSGKETDVCPDCGYIMPYCVCRRPVGCNCYEGLICTCAEQIAASRGLAKTQNKP